MKKFIVVCAVIALILAAAVFEQIYTKNTFRGIEREIDAVSAAINAEKEHIDKENTIEIIDGVIRKWDNRQSKVFEIYLSHILINEFGYKLKSLRAHVAQNDYDMADTDVALIKENCRNLLEMNVPTLTNIF